MQRHCDNARELACRLEQHPAIEKVFYPALPSHEHHELAQRQMRGFGGVVTVWLRNDSKEAANSVIKNMKLVQMASSHEARVWLIIVIPNHIAVSHMK